uniref:Uncharacterized protein n=1 Tax=Nelumbo nucifera TaxID=4432 RepID=A0A822ZIK5_NELNU|nr:TPA_asm: hypothetical protein HUJ06_001429 [Nelumbo nucifera]
MATRIKRQEVQIKNSVVYELWKCRVAWLRLNRDKDAKATLPTFSPI